MHRPEWDKIVERINATWTSQPLSDATAAEWFEELAGFDAASVWLAIRRCRREQHFRPQLADVFDALDANDTEDRERRRVADQIRPLEPRRRGRPMPPEFRRAWEIAVGSVDLAGLSDLDGTTANEMIQQLADQHEARTKDRARPEVAADATRTCPECATSLVPGWTVTEGDQYSGTATYGPCRMCRPGRRAAVLASIPHLPCGPDGRPGAPGSRDDRKTRRSTRA